MELIKQWFKYDDEDYNVREWQGHLEAKTETVIFHIVSPHSGTNNRWMLRVSTISVFDRWANSTAIEKFFETNTALYYYLNRHQLDIYKELVEYLSKEYDELYDEME